MLTVERLRELSKDIEGTSLRSYSGRGMGGMYCTGFSTDNDQTGLLYELTAEAEDDELRDLIELFATCRTDAMGHRTIVFFPHMRWEDEADDD